MCWNKRHMNLPSVHFGNSSLPLEEQQHGLVQKWYLVLFLTNRAIFGWGNPLLCWEKNSTNLSASQVSSARTLSITNPVHRFHVTCGDSVNTTLS